MLSDPMAYGGGTIVEITETIRRGTFTDRITVPDKVVVNGVELTIPQDAPINIEAGDSEPVKVTLSFWAESVIICKRHQR